MKSGNSTSSSRQPFWVGVVILFCFFAARAQAATSLQDLFANRESITTVNGSLTGNNATATVETNEPKHGGKPGGHSLWITWIAPADGIATFDTHGSSFDTLLSAYTLKSASDTTVDRLDEQAQNDDDPGAEPTSLIQFAALAGHHYEIAVDGYQGATGSVVLNWSFLPTDTPPPIILSVPNDQAGRLGETITLSVNMTTSPDVQLAWFFNGQEDHSQTGASYVINSLQATNVGRYQLRITVGNSNNRVRFFTKPIEIQVNSEGFNNTLAADKLLDSKQTPLLSLAKDTASASVSKQKVALYALSAIGVVRGYNGSQVFNTTYATTDPAEPIHAGVASGASYWLLYQPPAHGTMTIDTIGSTYDTVMEVYSYDGALNGYGDLISITADNDNVSPQGPSRVTFQAVQSRTYVVVVAGVNSARGTAWLNYVLNTNLPAQPPSTQDVITTKTVPEGSSVLLAPAITGAPPLKYFWKKDDITLPAIKAGEMQLNNVIAAQTGNYSLIITNDLGSLTVNMPLHVVAPHFCSIVRHADSLDLQLPTVANFRYTIQQADAVTGPWVDWSPPFLGNGSTFTTNIAGSGTAFYRVLIE